MRPDPVHPRRRADWHEAPAALTPSETRNAVLFGAGVGVCLVLLAAALVFALFLLLGVVPVGVE